MKYKEKMSWYNQNYKEIYGYDFEPKSYWEFKKNTEFDKGIKDEVASDSLKKDLQTKKESLTYNKSWGARTALSKFNSEYAKNIINFYTTKNCKILDPFSGRTRQIICKKLGRNYTGFEINPKYSNDTINDDCINIEKYFNETDKFDFLFTCPPYWNREIYSDIKGDISNLKTYKLFLVEYQKRFEKCVKFIDDKGLCMIVVADFRDKEFYSLHYDTIRIFKEFGWNLYDLVILEMNPAARQCYYSQAITNRRTLMTHEYLLIFCKNSDIKDRKFNEDIKYIEQVKKLDTEYF